MSNFWPTTRTTILRVTLKVNFDDIVQGKGWSKWSNAGCVGSCRSRSDQHTPTPKSTSQCASKWHCQIGKSPHMHIPEIRDGCELITIITIYPSRWKTYSYLKVDTIHAIDDNGDLSENLNEQIEVYKIIRRGTMLSQTLFLLSDRQGGVQKKYA